MRLLITGINGFICDECVKQAYEILKSTGALGDQAEHHAADEPFTMRNVPKPKEIKDYLDQYVIGQDEAKKCLSVAV